MNLELFNTVSEQVKDRVSNKTISDHWKRVKEIALVVSSITGSTLGIIGTLSLTLPGWIVTTISVISVISINIAGRAQLDTSKKTKQK